MDHETAEDIKRHFNVVAEGLRSEIRTLAEGLGGTNERLDSVDSRLDSVDSRLERFEVEVAAQFKLVHEQINEIKAMIRISFGELDRRIRSLETDVSDLRSRLDRLEERSQA